MTIRFVQQWNGYSPDTIVTLAGAEETRLIGLGYAVTDLDGPGNTPLPVTSTTNLSGVIKILMPDGTYVSIPKQSDAGLDFVASGLTLPSSGTIGVASIAAGVAYVSGYRITHAGSVLALGATKDNYIDLDYDGNIVVSQVTVAAGAPAVAANAIRLGKLTTDATSVTARSVRAKDSNGVWMFNDIQSPHSSSNAAGLLVPYGSDVPINFGASTTNFDNDNMHSETVNPNRFTAQRTGVYDINAGVVLPTGGSSQTAIAKIFKNGSSAALGTISANASSTYALRAGGKIHLLAGDYVELLLNWSTSNITTLGQWFNITSVAQ
ncbi:MAG: hypothetical protein KBH41_17970 [Azonexus sp.]|nr:hypothetical protein [Azonexus sp.]